MLMTWSKCLVLIVLVFSSLPSWAEEGVPRVVIVAQNSGTEITDLLVPFSILTDAGLDVEILSTDQGPVNLMNGMTLLGLRSLEEYSGGSADLVVIPAVHHPNEGKLVKWLNNAYERGAMLASICDGVEVLANAGLLDGREATGHFYSLERREKNFPQVNWVRDTRYVHDGNILTTAGVTASIPAAVYLVETMLGKESAGAVGLRFGIDRSNAQRHNSDEFSIGAKEMFVAARNYVRGLYKTRYNIGISSQVDELLLALTVDALGRTYQASIALDLENQAVTTMRGLRFGGRSAHDNPHWRVQLGSESLSEDFADTLVFETPSQVFPRVFHHIQAEFGRDSAEFVATQLELPSAAWSK
jgi:putative intracellular protease/amidase